MKIWDFAAATAAAVAGLAIASAPILAEEGRVETKRDALVQQAESWTGTATCKVECKDGQCKVVTATCDAASSYEDARRRLEASLEAQARLENGKISGSISFSIKKKF